MKRLIVNIILFFVAVFLLSTVGVFGIIYAIIFTSRNFTKISFIKYWTDLIYSINIGIDRIGNVLLSVFMNRFTLIDKNIYPFGDVRHTISHCLAVNYFALNITKFGIWIVRVLEYIDDRHMEKSL